MLTVETIGRIRREHFLKGKTIKEIARDLKVSRNTVRRVLRSGATSFEYEREVQPRPKLGRWTAELDELLTSNAAKAAREQLTLIRVFEELRGRGYDGGYDAVRRYARRWAKERGQSTAAAYVPLAQQTPPDPTGGRYPPPRQALGRDGRHQCCFRSALRAAHFDARRRPGAGLHAHRPAARTREDEPQADRRPRRSRTIRLRQWQAQGTPQYLRWSDADP